MSETERARVGQALDLIRDALAAYVDDAMAKAYGPQWDERVADEDAKRRPNGQRHLVSKSDLAVLLKVIQHERIAPWSNSKTHDNLRIRSFASEILTLRNLFAHGNDCVNELVRLVDTASRLLQMLDQTVPSGLQPPDRVLTNDPSDAVAGDNAEQPPIAIDLFDSEVARLGESGERLAEMLRRVAELPITLAGSTLEAALSSVGQAAVGSFQSQQVVIVRSIGAEAFCLLEETYRLEADGEHDSAVQQVLIQLVRCSLFQPLLASAMLADAASIGADSSPSELDLRAARDRLSLMEKSMGQGPVERWRELVRLAHHLDDGSPIANSVIVMGNFEILDDPAIGSDEALRLLRDSSARARMLAAMDPGSHYDTWVILFLRREGKLCNDLGRPDEATRAFARVDEIVDRYPTADPDLSY